MKSNKTKVCNKGRITRIDQAWTAAHLEHIERGRVADAEEAYAQAWAHQCSLTRTADIDAAQEEAIALQASLPRVADNFTNRIQDAGGEVEPMNAPQAVGIAIPLKFVQAALVTAGNADIRYYLNGVYIHAVDGDLRIVSTDGHRMTVSSFEPDINGPLPDWTKEGIIIRRDDLEMAMPVLIKNGKISPSHTHEPMMLLDHAVNRPLATIGTMNGFASFATRPIDGKFPEYARVLSAAAANLTRGEGEAMKAGAIDTRFVKGAALVAERIGARAIHAFIGGDDDKAPAHFFTFSGAPCTAMVIMPMRGDEHVSDNVVKLVGRTGIANSIAAFKSHLTRTVTALGSAKGESRKALEHKREALDARIKHLIDITSIASKQLTAHAA